jgi:hypothetical protein
MKHILLLLSSLMIIGCGGPTEEEQAAHDAMVAQKAKEELLKELKAKEENQTYSYLGISKNDGKITIDTNQTKAFLETILQTMEQKADNLTKELENGVMNQTEAGIEMNNETITIDFNKTKSFLEGLDVKLNSIITEVGGFTDVFTDEVNQTHGSKN